MMVLPIVGRELVEAARRRSTYYLRMAAAAAGLAAGAVMFLVLREEPAGALGMGIFIALTVLVHIYCLFTGLFRTADSLSEEKREGTLGLLFLTDLRGYDIVMGKLAATSLNAFYGALALLPVLAIPLLAGGVAPGDFWRTVVVALNNLFLSLSVGMFCSAISRDERRSMGLAFILVLGLAGGLPFVGALWCDWQNSMRFYPWFLILSPGFDAVMAFEIPAAEFAKQFGGFPFFLLSVGLVHLLSWGFLAAACFIVPRTWQDKPLSAAALARRERAARAEIGTDTERTALRRRWLEMNPFLWLASRGRLKQAAVRLFLAGIACIWLAGVIPPRHRQQWLDPVPYAMTMLLVHTVFKVWLVSEATRRFSADRQSGALELLLSTPLSVGEILRGQCLALARQFGGPALLVLAVDGVFLLAERRDQDWVSVCLAGMVVFAVDMVTLAWVGMWRGLNSRHSNRAAMLAIAQVLVLPWVLWGLFMVGVALVAWSAPGAAPPTWIERHLPVALWTGIALAVNAAFGLPAARRLAREFRSIATSRFEARRRK